MFRKFLPLAITFFLVGCASMGQMQGGTCCPKAEHKCMCAKCECTKCESGKCSCHKGKDTPMVQSKEGKTCTKKELKAAE